MISKNTMVRWSAGMALLVAAMALATPVEAAPVPVPPGLPVPVPPGLPVPVPPGLPVPVPPGLPVPVPPGLP
ncbi:MAG: hypothetical protein ACREN8_13825, partial [Candidatus Dormibacteraceae bacterium]